MASTGNALLGFFSMLLSVDGYYWDRTKAHATFPGCSTFSRQQAVVDLGIHRSGGTNILPTEKFKISMSTD